jgi:integrase
VRTYDPATKKQGYAGVEWIGRYQIKPTPPGTFYISWQGPDGKIVNERVGVSPADRDDAIRAHNDKGWQLSRGQRGASATGTQPQRRLFAEAVERFLREKAISTRDNRAVSRNQDELADFATACGIEYLDQIDRSTMQDFILILKKRGLAPRTVYNRLSAIGTFLNRSEQPVKFKFTTVRKRGDIPNFSHPEPNFYSEDQLRKFFGACDQEERLWYMFFLHTGAREREVAFACWSDFEFAPEPKPGEKPLASVFVVQPKDDLKFFTKNGERRRVPIHDDLVNLLKAHRVRHPNRRLIFETRVGKPEGHFLFKFKRVAFRAGLNCGMCQSRKGKSCAEGPVCKEWTLHRLRRTWAKRYLDAGVSTFELQLWIGHSDQEMLRRYVRSADAQSAQTHQKVKAAFAGLNI